MLCVWIVLLLQVFLAVTKQLLNFIQSHRQSGIGLNAGWGVYTVYWSCWLMGSRCVERRPVRWLGQEIHWGQLVGRWGIAAVWNYRRHQQNISTGTDCALAAKTSKDYNLNRTLPSQCHISSLESDLFLSQIMWETGGCVCDFVWVFKSSRFNIVRVNEQYTKIQQ